MTLKMWRRTMAKKAKEPTTEKVNTKPTKHDWFWNSELTTARCASCNAQLKIEDGEVWYSIAGPAWSRLLPPCKKPEAKV
jgi:hypothetical protein